MRAFCRSNHKRRGLTKFVCTHLKFGCKCAGKSSPQVSQSVNRRVKRQVQWRTTLLREAAQGETTGETLLSTKQLVRKTDSAYTSRCFLVKESENFFP